MTLVVGLTGGIGSGKSAAAEAFAALGAPICDTDRLAHALSAPGQPGFDAIVGQFGTAFVRADGTLDRAMLRERVFADDRARAALESLLHPMIRDAALAEVASWQAPYGLLVVPLLLERGNLSAIVARVLVVDCPDDEQVRRVMRRSGLDESAVRAIMATQLSRAERLARADDVIDNSGPPSAMAPQVELLDRRYRALAGAPAVART